MPEHNLSIEPFGEMGAAADVPDCMIEPRLHVRALTALVEEGQAVCAEGPTGRQCWSADGPAAWRLAMQALVGISDSPASPFALFEGAEPPSIRTAPERRRLLEWARVWHGVQPMLQAVAGSYTQLRGLEARGVDWRDAAAHEADYRQLVRYQTMKIWAALSAFMRTQGVEEIVMERELRIARFRATVAEFSAWASRVRAARGAAWRLRPRRPISEWLPKAGDLRLAVAQMLQSDVRAVLYLHDGAFLSSNVGEIAPFQVEVDRLEEAVDQIRANGDLVRYDWAYPNTRVEYRDIDIWDGLKNVRAAARQAELLYRVLGLGRGHESHAHRERLTRLELLGRALDAEKAHRDDPPFDSVGWARDRVLPIGHLSQMLGQLLYLEVLLESESGPMLVGQLCTEGRLGAGEARVFVEAARQHRAALVAVRTLLPVVTKAHTEWQVLERELTSRLR
jgi:hypothetical protein